jgi:hypothetical protein
MVQHRGVGKDRTPPVRRATVAEAADVLGISAEAVRGRVRRGTLPVEREGRTVHVLLERPVDGRTTDDLSRTKADQTGDHTEILIAELRDRVRSLEAANRENRRIITALTQRLPELEAARVTPERPERAAAARDADNPIMGAPSGVTRDPAMLAAENHSTAPRANFLSRGAIIAELLPRPRQELEYRAHFLAVVLPIWLVCFGTVVDFLDLSWVPVQFFGVALFSPLFFGFWLSLRWLGRHPRNYVFGGLLVGLALCGFFVWLLFAVEASGPAWVSGLATYVVSPALLFVAGGLLGDLVKRWAAERAPAGEYPAAPGEQALSNRERARDTIVVALITALATLMVPILNRLLGL